MESYSHDKSLKTGKEAAFFNVNSLFSFPAPFLVRLIYPTSISSHQVIYISLVTGVASGYFLSRTEFASTVAGVILLLLKNILDKADGQLARARGTASRYGRFLDSISDFIVNSAVFAGLTWRVYQDFPGVETLVLGIGAFVFNLLHCSYFIYYQVSYINLVRPLDLNRVNEAVTEEDIEKLSGTGVGIKTLRLQRVYLWIYGWQDALVRIIDTLLYSRIKKRYPDADALSVWYGNKRFLSLASVLGLGVQIGFISVFSLFDRVYIYFWFVCAVMNLYLLFLIAYRYKEAGLTINKCFNDKD
ncbi:CDP-alcohol phosphatidyltransferase family protein [candidate division KSB1 bacterium]